jgi:hypothetical protein
MYKGNLFYTDDGTTYHYGCHEFSIRNGIFLCDELSFKLPIRTTLSTVERLFLSLGVPISNDDVNADIDITRYDIKDILMCCVLLALKDLSIINGSFKTSKQIDYANHILGAYIKSVTGAGNIKSKNKHIRWLNEKDTLQLKAKLFETSSYQAGVSSMIYTPTEFAENIFQTAFELIKSLDFKHDDTVVMQDLDFRLDINLLSSLKLRDIMLILNQCVAYNNGFIIRPDLTDCHYGRVYSIFTSISAITRKQLGFINYDIGSALQTICLQLVSDASIYPLHLELSNNKQTFRQRVSDETGKDLAWVKQELSSADNRDTMPKKYANYPTLKAYFEEALILRVEVINSAEEVMLLRAKNFAKSKFKIVWIDREPKFEFDGKKESSIFFFLWTQWERKIRKSMMSCFDNPNNCHQVHDAVYSMEDIDPCILESKVLSDTGFKVKISKD